VYGEEIAVRPPLEKNRITNRRGPRKKIRVENQLLNTIFTSKTVGCPVFRLAGVPTTSYLNEEESGQSHKPQQRVFYAMIVAAESTNSLSASLFHNCQFLGTRPSVTFQSSSTIVGSNRNTIDLQGWRERNECLARRNAKSYWSKRTTTKITSCCFWTGEFLCHDSSN
jgi:hypothetical protein